MGSFNQVILLGNICRDIELRYTPSGTAVGEFGLAVNRKTKDKEETFFGGCKAFGSTAETLQKHVGKGDPLFIKGRLSQDEWQDKQTGGKRSKTYIIVESFQFVGKRGERNQTQSSEPDVDENGVPF